MPVRPVPVCLSLYSPRQAGSIAEPRLRGGCRRTPPPPANASLTRFLTSTPFRRAIGLMGPGVGRTPLPEVHFSAAIRSMVSTRTSFRTASAFGGGPIRWLILGGTLLIAAIAIGATLMAGNFRERALRNSERELENTVLLLARHFDQQLEDFQVVQKDLIAFMRSERDRDRRELQAADVRPGHPSDAEIQDRGAVLCRRRQRLRRRRQVDQCVGGLAGARDQRRRPRLLPDLQVRPAIARDAGRTGAQPHHRRLDHGHRAQGHRAERRIPRRHRPRHRARPISKNSSPPWRSGPAPRSPCTIATAPCWRVIRMPRR